MSNWPFRFLHAADFHLETPLFGLEEAPEHLVELLIDAPYRAAARVFDTALAENVDFVVLSGDLLHSRHTGPRGPIFLRDQFERLVERRIVVYWAAGRTDPPEAWPPSIPLPDNVRRFTRAEPEQYVHRRGDTAAARVIGASQPPSGPIRPKHFDPEEPGLFTIAVAHGRVAPESLKTSRADYWALGGRHARQTLCESMPVAHDPGSPQGRHPEETGPHGCTLVEVDLERNVRTTPIATDVARWEEQLIAVNPESTRADLEREMDDRTAAMRQNAPRTDLLISWRIRGAGPLADQLRRDGLAAAILARSREQFGNAPPTAWSVGLVVEPPARYADAWYEEDTIRGQLLRELRQFEEDSERPLGLEMLLPAGAAASPLGSLLLGLSESSRAELIRETAALGVDLVTAEETQP
jgi:DNA repair protein SbcD/Mre11